MKNIEEILEKYFAGETSLAEELFLSDYFSADENIPEHLSSYKYIFCGLKEESQMFIDNSFDDKIMSLIAKKQRVHRTFLYSLSGIAATLFLGIFLFFSHGNKAYVVENGIRNNSEEAANKAAEDALKQVSMPLQKSLQFLEPLSGLKNSEGTFEDMSKLKTGMKALDLPYCDAEETTN
jgi:hypothetical protein